MSAVDDWLADEGEPYGWIITKDVLFEGGGFERSDVGVMGPRNIPAEMAERLNQGEGLRFRMKDGDGEVYYEGRIVFANPAIKVTKASFNGSTDLPRLPVTDSIPEEGFGPLNDFGMPNAGCTDIEYWASGLGGGWLGL